MAPYKVAMLFGTLVAETILASVHVRAHQQAGHMNARDLIKALQNTLRGGARPHMGLGRVGDGGQGGRRPSYSRDLRIRAIRTHHRLCDGPTLRGADLDGDHREHGAVAAAPADGRQPTDALVAEGCASDAEGPNRGRERDLQPGPYHCRAVGPSAVS